MNHIGKGWHLINLARVQYKIKLIWRCPKKFGITIKSKQRKTIKFEKLHLSLETRIAITMLNFEKWNSTSSNYQHFQFPHLLVFSINFYGKCTHNQLMTQNIYYILTSYKQINKSCKVLWMHLWVLCPTLIKYKVKK